ncbi:MAG: tRNA pseudouridine(38-40) synthase TruA, partial [Candidatus Cloacimonetes bacterium]|nr:tRNA pseudouridine(38-40) synthase TruA [Candidatus Cloacimonadota bacterium]
MKRFVMKLAYDGANYHGWQYQINGITIQQVLEDALYQIAKEPVKVIGSGRTDAGVHALSQYAHFDFPVNMTPLQIKLALRTKLPLDISVDEVYETQPGFNARFDAYSRTYHYKIAQNRTPFNRHYYSYFARQKINPVIIYKCLDYFKGTHDFSAFSKPNPEIPSSVCTITDLSFIQNETGYTFIISANRFLHNMVRRIVGTIILISDRNGNPELIAKLIADKLHDQKNIVTAPPQGLYLSEVLYPEGLIKQDNKQSA